MIMASVESIVSLIIYSPAYYLYWLQDADIE